jgi:hypothetical protein
LIGERERDTGKEALDKEGRTKKKENKNLNNKFKGRTAN